MPDPKKLIKIEEKRGGAIVPDPKKRKEIDQYNKEKRGGAIMPDQKKLIKIKIREKGKSI